MQNDNQNNIEGQFSEDAVQDEMEQGGERAEETGQAARQGGGRGFAGMSEQKRREIASKGGRSQGKENNSGNFANNRDKAVAAGRLGGQNSRGGGRQAGEQNSDTSENLDAE